MERFFTIIILVIGVLGTLSFGCAVDDPTVTKKVTETDIDCNCPEPVQLNLADGEYEATIERDYYEGAEARNDDLASGTATITGTQLIIDLGEEQGTWNLTLEKTDQDLLEEEVESDAFLDHCKNVGDSWLNWIFPVAYACSCVWNTHDNYAAQLVEPATFPESMGEFAEPSFQVALDYSYALDPDTEIEGDTADANVIVISVTDGPYEFGEDQLLITLKKPGIEAATE